MLLPPPLLSAQPECRTDGYIRASGRCTWALAAVTVRQVGRPGDEGADSATESRIAIGRGAATPGCVTYLQFAYTTVGRSVGTPGLQSAWPWGLRQEPRWWRGDRYCKACVYVVLDTVYIRLRKYRVLGTRYCTRVDATGSVMNGCVPILDLRSSPAVGIAFCGLTSRRARLRAVPIMRPRPDFKSCRVVCTTAVSG